MWPLGRPPSRRRGRLPALRRPPCGFHRLRCPDCAHEYLLAFTCKQRGLCAACHQRRALTEAAFIADEVCAAVLHSHLVFTVPRLQRTGLPYPRIKADGLYHRQWMLSANPEEADHGYQADAEEVFDQTGFELPPWREPVADSRQGSLFADDGPQLDPPDSEPVFTMADSSAEPDDDFIQPDAPDDAGQ